MERFSYILTVFAVKRSEMNFLSAGGPVLGILLLTTLLEQWV